MFRVLVPLCMLAETNDDIHSIYSAAASRCGIPRRPAVFSTWWAALHVDMLAVAHGALSRLTNSHMGGQPV
jgi:hypothetical protein